MQNVAAECMGETPREKLIVDLDGRSMTQFFEQMQNFSDEFEFAMLIGRVHPIEELYSVQVWRSDIKIIAVNLREDDEFDIGFFDNDCDHPITEEILDTVVERMKIHLEQIET